MPEKFFAPILVLPIELVYRILDSRDMEIILLHIRNVCTRFNVIMDTYKRYQVKIQRRTQH